MRKYKVIILNSLFTVMVTLSCNLNAQKSVVNKGSEVVVGFYNLENLFDNQDDTLTNDNDFLASGYKAWNSEKFCSKLIKLGKAIISMGNFGPPDILGICEIENSFVIQQLLYNSPLKNWNLNFIHENSSDRRGIDVALIYNTSSVEILKYKYQSIDFGSSNTLSRDILLVKCVVLHCDTIIILVNHWPSRYGGYMSSEWKRKKASDCVVALIDSIVKIDKNLRIIITGDFNDDPDSPSIMNLIENNYTNKLADKIKLTNLMSCNNNLHEINGTIKHNSKWHVFDQMIVNESFIDKSPGIKLKCKCMKIFAEDYFLIHDAKFGGYKPFRTYEGAKYINGFSDHLPVTISLIKHD